MTVAKRALLSVFICIIAGLLADLDSRNAPSSGASRGSAGAEGEATVGAVYEGVKELQDSEFPALVKAGCREAAGRLVQENQSVDQHHPGATRHPSSSEEGNSGSLLIPSHLFLHTFYDRAHSIVQIARGHRPRLQKRESTL